MPARSLPLAVLYLTLAAGAKAHGPGHAHQHGIARLEVSIEGQQLALRLEAPLHDLIGFERPPRRPAEQERARRLLERFREPQRLFTLSAEAQCTPVQAKVEAPVLMGGEATGEHAELVAEYRYTCVRAARLKGMKVELFALYPGIRRMDAAVVTEGGQSARRLTARMPLLHW